LTVTLDEVACLLHIPIVGRLMGDELGLTAKEAMSEVNKQWGGYISIPNLKIVYDRLVHRCDELEQPANEEEAEELDRNRTVH